MRNRRIINATWPTNLHGIDLQVQLLMLDQTVDALGKDHLQITLAGSTTCVGCHHTGDWSIGAQQGPKLRCGIKLCRQHRLEHGQKEMLFSAFVLVSVEGEHNGLKEGVDLSQANEATERSDMARL